MTTRAAYEYGRKLHAQGYGIAAAMEAIKANVPHVTGFERWAANDGFALARRGEHHLNQWGA